MKRYGLTIGRRAIAISGFLLAAFCMYAGAQAENSYTAVVLLSLGDGFLYFGAAAIVGTNIDIAGPHSGTVYGLTATLLQIGGAIAPTLTPIIATGLVGRRRSSLLHSWRYFRRSCGCLLMQQIKLSRSKNSGSKQNRLRLCGEEGERG